MANGDLSNYPEILRLRERLNGGKPDELICLFVPSHDRKHHPIADKAVWENEALELFGRLFDGATSFAALSGIYHPKKHLRPDYDNPTMVQSLTATKNIQDDAKLIELSEFCRRMGKKTNQKCVGVVFNNVFIEITIVHSD